MAENIFPEDPWCLTLPEWLAEATDFKAKEAIKIDMSIKLPESFSLWQWIYKTSNQWTLWACTSLWTTHATQILIVKKKWEIPTTKNILTPEWKDLWSKMWHSTTKYDWWDYVERAVNTALKEWILIEENWKLAKFDWYAYWDWDSSEYDKDIDMMKRYIYNWNPIVWCVRWDKKMWSEMSAWEVKTVPSNPKWWHCIALVWYDANWFWFINSWMPNDANKRKSRFHVSYSMMKKLWPKFNWRYRILYIKDDAKVDPEYLKRMKIHLTILQALKKHYDKEDFAVKQAIIVYSQAVRKRYPEINDQLPLNW